MTVADAIAALKLLDPDLKLCIDDGEGDVKELTIIREGTVRQDQPIIWME